MSEEKWKCPNCGTENSGDDNFCSECGGKKPVVGIGIAHTVKKQETIEKRAVIDESALEKPNKKGAGKIVLILVAICVAATVCGVVINAQNKAKIAEQQRIEAEERAKIAAEKTKIAEAETQKAKSGGGVKIGSLYWSRLSSNEMDWQGAINYCENLTEGGGYSDWRLPNIDELRTLIENCPKMETGGQCKVSEKSGCLSSSCWQKDSCYCEYEGDYSKLVDSRVLWSSSTKSDNPNNAWFVHFGSGRISYNGKTSNYYVRCVR